MHPKTPRNPKGAGRPPVAKELVDWGKVEHLAYLGVPQPQIAAYFGVSVDTLQRKAEADGVDIAACFATKQAERTLRIAEQLDAHAERWGPAAIFLAKQPQYLGYRDDAGPRIEINGPITFQVSYQVRPAVSEAQAPAIEGEARVMPLPTPEARG